MVRAKFAHSFARHRLEQSGLKIYHDGKQILTPVNSNFRDTDTRWDYGDFVTRIKKGIPFLPDSEKKARVMRSYEEFIAKTGLMISARRPTMQRFSGQKVEYYLTHYDAFKRDVNEIPRGHRVEVDLNRGMARLVGGNSLGNWFYYKKSNVGGKGYWGRKGFLYEKKQSYEELLGQFTNFEQKQVEEFVPINEYVVGIDLDSSKIVCIPEQNFNPVIFICGKRGQGKTILHYSLMDNFYHKGKKKCVDLIDISYEAPEHCLEWKNLPKFIDGMNLDLIGQTTRALPIVYLTPSTVDLKDIPLKDEIGYEMTLPFNEIIYDYENIFRGNKYLEFEKTAVYFNSMLYDDEGNKKRDGLEKCVTIKQQADFIHNFLSENTKRFGLKNPEGVTSKMLNTLKYLANLKILDTSKKTNSKWVIEFSNGEKKEYSPPIACILADLIPSFNVDNLSKYIQIFSSYMNFIINDLFYTQSEDPLLNKNNSELFLFLNEASSVMYDNITKKLTIVSDLFDKVIRVSRMKRIGIVFGTQDLDQISDFARTQSNYIFSFNQNAKNANILVNDFDALKEWESDLKRLQPFECIGFPSTSPFHLYDEYGKLEVVKDTPIKMRIFPSLSAHRPPKKIGGD